MSWMEVIEVEEFVGTHWHRIISNGVASYGSHPDAAVTLDQVRASLGVFFRGLGGAKGVEIAAAKNETSHHRLSFRQRMGLGEERTIRPTLDGHTLMLPIELDIFPEKQLNKELFYWLSAFFAACPDEKLQETDNPFHRDLHFLKRIYGVQLSVLQELPGIRPIWTRLSYGLRMMRPNKSLPPLERMVEDIVLYLLGGEKPDNSAMAYVFENGSLPDDEVLQYKPFLPVPLWGEILEREMSQVKKGDQEMGGDMSRKQATDRKLRSQRRELDQANRDDGFFLHIYDKIMSIADMLNVNRNVEDEEEDEAVKAIDDLERVTVSEHDKKAATKIKMDLDLPGDEVDETRLTGEKLLPEWHYRKGIYLQDHCRVLMRTGLEEGEDWTPDEAARRRIRRVKRQFEALQAKREVLHAQPDGEELDLEAVVRARADIQASGRSSNRLYLSRRMQTRDLAISLLVDVSLSTDSWLDNHRVIDVEKEALTILGNGLAACGDDFAINTFTSRKRDYVRVDCLKGFDESFGPQVQRRISALKPGYYTRIGAALRAAAQDLAERPNRQKLLLVITDGKPNDVDHYEGRYGIEDSRKAVQECRQMGLSVFGVTVDQKAQDYFPYIFGRGSYQIVGHVAKLSTALPKIYRQLVKGS
jgi:nitric oxide reductase NorD protein